MIFRNSLAVTLARLSGYLYSLLLAPIMLARLGLELYGLWAVTGAFAIYAGLMDFGVTRALSRFVAFYHARGDRRAVEQLFGFGLIVVALVAAVSAVIAAAAAPFVASALGDVLSASDMRALLLAVVGIFSLNLVRGVIRAVPEGMQDMVPVNAAEFVNNTLNFAFSVGALIVTRDVVLYAYANVAAGVLALGPSLYAARLAWSPVRARVPSRVLIREVLGFSVKSQLSWIGDLVNNQTDKIIIAVFIDVRVAGAYEIANRVVLTAKSVAVLSLSALLPAATDRLSRDGRGIVGEFYRHYTTRFLGVALPLMAFCCVAAPALLTAWLGDVPPDAATVVGVLTLANCVNLTTGVAFSISLGDGKAGMIAIVSLLTVVLNVVATVALTPFFGLWGVIAGTMTGIVGGSTAFIVYFHREYRLPAVDYLRAAGIPAAAAALAALPVAVFLLAAPVQDGDRWSALAAVVACLGLFAAVYWPLASTLDILPGRLNLRSLLRTRRRRASRA